MPLRPIISSRVSVIYGTAIELTRILKPLLGRSPHHVQNTMGFISSLGGIQLKPDECIMSYDVNALFISVPIPPTVNIIRNTWKKTMITSKNINDSKAHLLPAWVLSWEYIFLIPRQVLWAKSGCCYELTIKSLSSQLIYGGSGSPSHQYFTNPLCSVERICGWCFHHHQESKEK